MAFEIAKGTGSLGAGLAFAFSFLLTSPALAMEPAQPAPQAVQGAPGQTPPAFSPQCEVPATDLAAPAPLPNLTKALDEHRFNPFGFEIFVDLGIGEAGVGAEINARELATIARHDRLQNALPAIGAVHAAGAQGATFQVAILVE
jgi:hypothetical protein